MAVTSRLRDASASAHTLSIVNLQRAASVRGSGRRRGYTRAGRSEGEFSAPGVVELVAGVMHAHHMQRLLRMPLELVFDACIDGLEERVAALGSGAVERQRVEEVALQHSAGAGGVELQQRRDTQGIRAGLSADVAGALQAPGGWGCQGQGLLLQCIGVLLACPPSARAGAAGRPPQQHTRATRCCFRHTTHTCSRPAALNREENGARRAFQPTIGLSSA